MVGGAGPPALLLHGFPQNLYMWATVAPLLARKYTVVAADLRGYGASDKPRARADNSNYSFRAMAQDQVMLMRRLGFERFHVIGHDRGGRTGHRMALDAADAVLSLSVLDIAPTHAMFSRVNRQVAGTYWHWYFLSTAPPFAENVIAKDPDTFFQYCLTGRGDIRLEEFDPDMLAEYRRSWNTRDAIHGFCADYRAAATVDMEHDTADIDRKPDCPTLVLWGADGALGRLFDLEREWSDRCSNVRGATLPGGHFFVEQFPRQTAEILQDFIGSGAVPKNAA